MRRSIAIVGTATKGQTGELKLIRSDMDITSMYGSGSLIDTYRLLRDNVIGDDVDIFALKGNGIHGTAFLHVMDISMTIHHNAIYVSTSESKEGPSITITITDDEFLITHGTTELVYEFSVFTTIGELIRQVNEDSRSGISPVCMSDTAYESHLAPSYSLSACNKTTIRVSKSYSGIDDNKNVLFHATRDTLGNIIGKPLDAIILSGCYIDNTRLENTDSLMDSYKLTPVYTDDHIPVYMVDNTSDSHEVGDRVFVSDGATTDSGDDLIDEYYPDMRKKELSFYKLLCDFSKAQSYSGIITKGILGFKPNLKSANYYAAYGDYVDRIINEADYNFKSLVSTVIGEVYYDRGAIIDGAYIAYAGAYISTSYLENVENSRCTDNIKTKDIIPSTFITDIKDLGFITIRHSTLTKGVHFINTRTKGDGMLSFEYVIIAIELLYKKLVPSLREKIGEALTPINIDRFKGDVNSVLSSFVGMSTCTSYDYSIKTTFDGDTYIRCDLFFPGFLTPFRLIAELGGKLYE